MDGFPLDRGQLDFVARISVRGLTLVAGSLLRTCHSYGGKPLVGIADPCMDLPSLNPSSLVGGPPLTAVAGSLLCPRTWIVKGIQ